MYNIYVYYMRSVYARMHTSIFSPRMVLFLNFFIFLPNQSSTDIFVVCMLTGQRGRNKYNNNNTKNNKVEENMRNECSPYTHFFSCIKILFKRREKKRVSPTCYGGVHTHSLTCFFYFFLKDWKNCFVHYERQINIKKKNFILVYVPKLIHIIIYTTQR